MTHLIHLSDTHIGASPDFVFGGALVLPRLRGIVDAINDLDFEPDLIIHTGDVVDDPSEEAYLLVAEEMKRLAAPVYYARGNHDGADLMLEHLPMGEREVLDEDGSALAYRIPREDHDLFVLDGCDSGRSDLQGEISKGQMEAFAAAAGSNGKAFSVFIHYPPLALDCPWVDRAMLLHDGEDFHRFLASIGSHRVRGVFFGHVHSGIQIWRDGILYSGVGSACCRIKTGPNAQEVMPVPESPVFFNHVSFFSERTVVREHSVPVSERMRIDS